MDSLFESKLQQFKKTIDDIRGEMESIQNVWITLNIIFYLFPVINLASRYI